MIATPFVFSMLLCCGNKMGKKRLVDICSLKICKLGFEKHVAYKIIKHGSKPRFKCYALIGAVIMNPQSLSLMGSVII